MAKSYALKGEKREGTGKGVARALRRENKIPSVIYGDKKAPVNIQISAKDANLEYQKGQMFTTLCDLDVDGDTHQVLARDVQLHPVTDFVQHIDFLRVTSKTRIQVNVPVHVINEDKSPGLQEKGTLNMVRHEVELACRATKIPDFIELDLSGAEIGDTLNISDIELPEGASPVITDRDFTIATIAAPRRIEEVVEEGVEGEEAEGVEGEEAEGAEAAEGEEAAAEEGGEE